MNSAHRTGSRKKSRKTMWVILLLIFLGGGGVFARYVQPSQDDSILTEDPVFEVVKGPLTISVSEAGTIKAKDQEILKSEVEGRTTILTLIPEGTLVKEGDLLIELDATALEDARVDQQISVQNAEAAYVGASENYAVTENQADSDVEQASLTLFFAVKDFSNYAEGDFPKLEKEADAKITLASEELYRATEELRWSKILFNEKYLSQTQLQQDEIAAHKADLDLELAKADRDLLKQYTYERTMKQLESDVFQAKMAFERAVRKARADVIDASAALRARQSEFDRQKMKLEKLEEQIKKAKIFAPTDGLVIYATSAKASWRGNQEPLDEGKEVREREELIYLPTTSSVKADIKVHESNLDKISVGLPARVTVDAVPGKSFTGRVTKISPLPDAQSVYLNPELKVYATEVDLEGDAAELRTGMSCLVEILVDHFEDAVHVPIQAAVRVSGESTVYVLDENGEDFTPRAVETGLDNNRMLQVVSGLEEGEQVWLTPPLAAGDRGAAEGMKGISKEEGERLKEAAQISKDAEAKAKESKEETGEGQRGGRGGREGRSPEGGGRGGGRGGGITPEMRKMYESMTPEQREKARSQFQRRAQQGS